MALNKFLLLDEVQLLKSMQEKGYEDIANILNNRHIDGHKFLDLSEFQTISWKLPISQQKNLFNFIKRVKEDPYVLLQKGPNINKPSPIKPKPYLPATPKPSNSASVTKLPPKKISLSNTVERKEFKQKLGDILDGTNSPKSSSTPTDFESKPTYPRPTPIEINKPKAPLPLPPEPDPPTESGQSKPKVKSFLPEPTRNSTSSIASQRSKVPTRNLIIRPQSPEEEYEDIDKLKEHIDEGYLSPNEFDRRKKKTHKALENDEGDLENNYEPAPSINKLTIFPINSYGLQTEKLKMPVNEKEKGKISPVAGRAPIPIPTESNQSDEEEHDYEPLPQIDIRNSGGRTNTEMAASKQDLSRADTTSLKSRKYTVEDLENIIIVEEDQSKRPNNFLGTLTKLFTTKSRSIKPDEQSSVPMTYENHMLKSEISSLKIPNFKSVQNRPLPEIPVFHHSNSNSSSIKRREMKVTKNKQPEPSIEKRSFPRRKNSIVELRGSDVEVIKNNRAVQEIGSNRVSVESEKSRNTDQESDDLPVYENKHSLKNSATSSQRNSASPLPFLTDELAAKLSEELKKREKAKKEMSGNRNKYPQNPNPTKNIIKSKNLPEIDDEDDDQPLYGNVDELKPDDENSLHAEETVDHTNEIDEDDQPTYGNLDESDVVHEEEPVDTNHFEEEEEDAEEEEEQEEYIDSIFNINNEKFYRNTDRKGAKMLLRNLTDGAFLFRPSRKYFLVLTLKHQKKFYNLGIERTKNKIRLNADTSSVSPEFGTLRGFVDYFKREALTFRDGEMLVEIYLNPILPDDLF